MPDFSFLARLLKFSQYQTQNKNEMKHSQNSKRELRLTLNTYEIFSADEIAEMKCISSDKVRFALLTDSPITLSSGRSIKVYYSCFDCYFFKLAGKGQRKQFRISFHKN